MTQHKCTKVNTLFVNSSKYYSHLPNFEEQVDLHKIEVKIVMDDKINSYMCNTSVVNQQISVL